MKYEAVFGDQKRFNEQNNEMTEVMLWHDFLGPNFVSLKELSRMNSEGSIPHGSVVLAMRRIIAEPKRWTVEDQKAGRMPEVGSLVMVEEVETKNNIFEFCGVCAGSKRFAVKDITDGFLYFYSKEMIAPIETPQEKAQRLRSEWIRTASLLTPAVTGKLISDLGFVYDALLSGELPPVQAKGWGVMEWISVKDQLPPVGEQCLFYRPLAERSGDDIVAVETAMKNGQHSWTDTVPTEEEPCNPSSGACHVTHWMPLPSAPEQNK